jgi:hypothetical protein
LLVVLPVQLGGVSDITGGFDGQNVEVRGVTSGDDSDAGRRGGPAGKNSAHAVEATNPNRGPDLSKCTIADPCTRDDQLSPLKPLGREPAAGPAAAPQTGAPATPGIRDVARFLVDPPTAVSEPGGWTIVGAETNFIAGAGEREQAGTLLGQPVVVHFTPVGYEWRYGDGAARTTSSPGATWQASGQPDFAKTATSHAYAARGAYTVTVTVEFAARYRFAGQSWADIPGTLGLTSAPIVVNVKGVKTVLVGKTCDENPAGPGC